MIVPLKKKNVIFRNPRLNALDPKMVPLDHVLTNLFMLIASKGVNYRLGPFKKKHDIATLMERMAMLEGKGLIKGVSENKEAVEDWLRANLVSMVYRGNVVKEKVSSLQPMHLMSYRIQNKSHNRDYNASDQVYAMLRSCPEVLEGLRMYLIKGWDKDTSRVVCDENMDVDTAGILYLVQNINEKPQPKTEIVDIKPLLTRRTEIFNDDIRRLLVYSNRLPRTVFIEYLRILIGFHLALYEMNLIWMLPRMVAAGTTNIPDEWTMIVDLSDNLDSKVAPYACKDMETLANALNKYFKATFEINVVMDVRQALGKDSSVESCLYELKNELDPSSGYYQAEIQAIRREIKAAKGDNSEDNDTLKAIDEMLQYFRPDDYFGRYIHLLENASGGSTYQYKYHLQCLDSLTMKNSDSKLTASGVRMRYYPRRGAMGSKLLETLVQLLVLDQRPDGTYASRPLSIEELAGKIRNRYGLIINGIAEPRFANADVAAIAAFRENMDAFKDKLRQIGFYSDLSDSCILQKIEPRYKI